MKFSTICKVLKKIGSISGTNEKIALIKSIEDDDLKEVYKWLFDNSRISGIAEKKFEKDYGFELAGDWSTCDQKTIQDVFRYLDSHYTGAGKDVIEVKDLMEKICTTDEEKEIFKKIVCKNLPLGVDSKTINKCFPGLIPTFDVCLCDKYYDKPELVDGKREFAISTKIDGCRCIAIKENGNVRLISRQGKLWLGCREIEEAIQKLPMDNFVLDGEITIKNFMKYPSKDVYKMTTKIISTKDEEKKGVCLNVFDFMKLEEWNKKVCDFNLRDRYYLLNRLFHKNKSDALYLVPNIYTGNEPAEIEELMKGIVREEDWEGLVIKFTDSLYEWKRSKNWLKVKAFEEMDLIIKDVEEGTNSNKGRLGALICKIEHPKLGHIEAKVGSGYSEDERIRLWDMKDELIGRVISVQYFEQTENTSTHVKSLRFPVFLELKEEGQLPNN
jgi:DNA ligase-1